MANIRTARRSGLVLRGGRQRRDTSWGFIGDTNTTIAAPSTLVLFTGLTAAGLALRPFTIVRVRGVLHGRSDQQAAIERWGGTFAMSVVSEEALAAGATAVPAPEANRGSDAFFVFETQAGVTGVASGTSTGELGLMKEFDSRAMRKVEEGQDLALVVETSAQGSSWVVRKMGRFLVKLH